MTGTRYHTDGVEMVMPGDNATLHIELIAPVALTDGLAVRAKRRRQGGRRERRVEDHGLRIRRALIAPVFPSGPARSMGLALTSSTPRK